MMKVKEQSEKVSLKLSIQKTKIMASGPITSWQIDGETIETAIGFIFLGSKITVDPIPMRRLVISVTQLSLTTATRNSCVIGMSGGCGRAH